MKGLFKEPLMHFLVLGAAIFGIFQLLGTSPAPVAANQLVITDEDAARLSQQFQATWRRPPTEQELAALIDRQIEEEVLVREALALGLDRGDAIVRQRLAQKMTFLLEGAAEADVPSDEELTAHLAAYPERFERSPLVAFEQVLLAEGDVEQGLAALRSGADPLSIGDRTLLPRQFAPSPPTAVNSTFGMRFFDELSALPIGEWAGPVSSGYGPHLVRVEFVQPARVPELSEIRESVEQDWRASRRSELLAERFEVLRQRYSVLRPDVESAAE